MTCPVKPRLHMRCETRTKRGRGGFKVWVVREKYRSLYKSKKRRLPNLYTSLGWCRFNAHIKLAYALKRVLA